MQARSVELRCESHDSYINGTLFSIICNYLVLQETVEVWHAQPIPPTLSIEHQSTHGEEEGEHHSCEGEPCPEVAHLVCIRQGEEPHDE